MAFASAGSIATGRRTGEFASQTERSSTQNEQEKAKGEVDLKIDEMKSRNEPVYYASTDGEFSATIKKEAFAGSALNVREGNAGAIRLPTPEFPPIARAAQASGTVEVEVMLDEEGKVIAAQAISGHPLLVAASVKAARLAEFKPTRFHGKPVKIVGVIDYHFNY